MSTKYNSMIIGNGTLLVLLLMAIGGIFFSFHNAVALSGEVSYLFPTLLSCCAVMLAVLIYRTNTLTNEKLLSIQEQFEHLKKAVDQTKSQQNLKSQETPAEKANVDIEALLKKIIPRGTFSGPEAVAEKLLKNAAKIYEVAQGTLYMKDEETGVFSFVAGYAYYSETSPPTFIEGETLAGQVAKNREAIALDSVPEGYISVKSGLGESNPRHLLIVPILNGDGLCTGIIEVAALRPFSPDALEVFTRVGLEVGATLLSSTNKMQE